MKRIQAYGIVDHGIEHCQYFQGYGNITNNYDAYTGIGATPKDALEDALEQAAQDDWDVDPVVNELPSEPVVDKEEMYYYVTILIR